MWKIIASGVINHVSYTQAINYYNSHKAQSSIDYNRKVVTVNY